MVISPIFYAVKSKVLNGLVATSFITVTQMEIVKVIIGNRSLYVFKRKLYKTF